MSEYTEEVDDRDLQCPMPLLKAKQALHRLTEGQRLRVLATDSGSVRDFKAFADLSGHVLISSEEKDGVYYYLLEKHTIN